MKIIINGTEFKVPDDRKNITYGEICDLASQPRGASVTHDKGYDAPGCLLPGGIVKIRDGMTFSCMVTGNA